MPYKSKAQAAYFNIHKNELEKQGVDVGEWNAASKGKKLPKHVKKVKGGNTTLNSQSMKARALTEAPISNLKTKQEFRKRSKMGRI